MSPLQSTPLPAKPAPLALARGRDPLPHRRRSTGPPWPAHQLHRRHRPHLADEVEPVQQRAAQPPQVAVALARATAAAVGGAPARTAVAGGHQDRVGGELERALAAHDLDPPLLQRLPQGVERDPGELGQLVEEQHAAVGQRDLAGPRRGSPPPTRPCAEIVWCGARNGRSRISLPAASPAALCIWVISSASSSSGGGRRPGSRRASIVLPTPGGPTIRRLWPPAAAISSARLASSWPRTSSRSGPSASRAPSAAVGQRRLGCRLAAQQAAIPSSVGRADHLDAARPARPRRAFSGGTIRRS